VLYSCKKKANELVVRGKIFDPNTNAYVEGAKVKLLASKVESGIYNSNYTEVSSVLTDSDGNFSFDFTEAKVAGYRITVTKDRYFGYSEDINSDQIVSGTAFSPTYSIYPEGYVKLEIENFVSYDSLDNVTYSFTSGYTECDGCCDNTLFHGAGAAFHDTLICLTRGNQNVSVAWNVTKHNITTLHSDTFYCNAFDTVYYKINY